MATPTVTVSVKIDPQRLSRQAEALGMILDSAFGQSLAAPYREDLEGAWNLLHAMLDRAEEVAR